MSIINSKLYDHKLSNINIFHHMAKVINSHMFPGYGDFWDDRQMLRIACKESMISEDRLFLWMCSHHETYCLPLAEVLTEGTQANRIFNCTSAFRSGRNTLLYLMYLKDCDDSGAVTGDIYPMPYEEYTARILNNSHLAGHSALVTRFIRNELQTLSFLPSISPDSYYIRLELADQVFYHMIAS